MVKARLKKAGKRAKPTKWFRSITAKASGLHLTGVKPQAFFNHVATRLAPRQRRQAMPQAAAAAGALGVQPCTETTVGLTMGADKMPRQ